jgi:hypothetical protein
MPQRIFMTQRVLYFLLLILFESSQSQQIADTTFNPPIAKPAYSVGSGPIVMLDEAHFNFHTATGRYRPFAQLLRRDGYVVQASTSRFNKESLRQGKILVIANAIAEVNQGNWSLPNPSAFADDEIAAVREWVQEGGALLLIADHMPFAGAAEKLGAAFGIRFSNCFAMFAEQAQGSLFVFRRSNGALVEHSIINGRTRDERIDSLKTFSGSAFQVDGSAQSLLVLDSSQRLVLPETAWQFTAETPRLSAVGWLQGAALKFGKGRIAVFGEAAMFSAQLAGPNRQPVGMNSPQAPQNYRFLLNVMHWLSGLLD